MRKTVKKTLTASRIFMAEQKKLVGKPKNVGEFVVWFRNQRNWSQKDLAKVVEFSPIYLSQVENGQYELPIEFIRRLYLVMEPAETKVLESLILDAYRKPPTLEHAKPAKEKKDDKKPKKAPMPPPLSKLVKKKPVSD